MPKLTSQLNLDRCPHCNVYTPYLTEVWASTSTPKNGGPTHWWKVYLCNGCGGMILANSYNNNEDIIQMFPSQVEINMVIPERAREYLKQAVNSISSSAGSLMLSASSVDAMLKDKGFKEGSLYGRIDKAAKNHLITDEMSSWAHQVRLDANEQRHSDHDSPLPSIDDAKKAVDFVLAFAEYLYVLPSKVTKGITETTK